MKFLFSLFALMMLAGSCNSSKKVAENTNVKTSNKVQNTILNSYIITQIGDNDAISNELTIVLDEKSNKITGFAGCNSFFGTYTVQNSEISFSDIASTKKFCRQDIINVERQFLNALNRVNSISVKDNVLSLLENDTILIKGIKSVYTTKSDIVRNEKGTGITYQISSRGVFEYIYISETEILVSTDRGLNVRRQYITDQKDWKELNGLIEAVDLETFNILQAPTDKRSTDAAISANLALHIGDVEYMTPEFDHGNPPNEIEALVNKVLSIKENTVKQ